MGFASGHRMAHYEIVAAIGAGGMGEVYRARDAKLDREVAIKVLPGELATDPERIARLEREARFLASLNHPGIATLHGLEECGSIRFLVMELVTGETLAERIARGKVSVDEAVPLFADIARALEAAHEKGIIHRDLKPANIKVARDGRAKLLDFGLAKVFHERAPCRDSSQSPTLTRETVHGAVAGTASYMSPEQARGNVLDQRTDIWAFGCCLFEALTGKQAFCRRTVTDTLAAILHDEPRWEGLPRDTPGALRRILRRCLSKDRTRRFHHIADARIELEELGTPGDVPNHTGESQRLVFFAVGTALVGAIALSVAVSWWPRSPAASRRVHYRVPVAPATSLPLPYRSIASLADGTGFVYAAQGESPAERRLFEHRLDGADSEAMPRTEGAILPFVSPDGVGVGFFADGKLLTLSIDDSRIPVTLASATNPRGASWGDGGSIVFTPLDRGGLWLLSPGNPDAFALTAPDFASGEMSHRWPHFLPDEEGVLYTKWTLQGPIVAVYSMETGDSVELIDDATDAKYVRPGYLVFVRDNRLIAATFDPKPPWRLGSAVPVVADVAASASTGGAHFDVSPEGDLLYARGGNLLGTTRLHLLGRSGEPAEIASLGFECYMPRVSPDGDSILCTRDDPHARLWKYDRERRTASQVVEPYSNHPVWTPDGKRIVFRSYTEHGNAISWAPVDGSHPPIELYRSHENVWPRSISPDGASLAFDIQNPGTGRDVWLLPLHGDPRATPVIATEHDEGAARFSPDGRWLAFVSNRSGTDEVYVQAFPGPGPRLSISTEGGGEPVWSARGDELYFRMGDRVMAVSLSTTGTELRASPPRELFVGSYHRWFSEPNMFAAFDVMPDGRFVMVPPYERPRLEAIDVVLHWSEDLAGIVPPE